MFRLFAILLLLVPCCSAQGQIKLSETKVQTYVGFENPRIVDGVVYANAGSKPIIASQSLIINVDNPDGFRFVQVESIRKSDFAAVPLIEESKGVQYRIPPDAQHGVYRITARGFDPEKGFAQPVSLDVTVDGVGPGPLPPTPGPVPPKPSNDTDRLVDTAMIDLRRGYSKAFGSAADAIASGQITIDAQLQSYLEPITRKAREDALAGIDGLIEDGLPRDGTKIKPEAAGFIRELSVSFERGTK